MALARPETIEIQERIALDGRKHLKVRELIISGVKVASAEQQRSGNVKFRFNPVGAFDWSEAKVWLQGLLELSTHAEELENGK